jgi:hypothetical protein
MSRHSPSSSEQKAEKKVIGKHIITPPATFYKKGEIEDIQRRYQDEIRQKINILQAMPRNSSAFIKGKNELERKAESDSRIAVILYKKFRKEGNRNDRYSTVPGIKMYTTSSGLLYITDENRFASAQIDKSDFEKIEHNIWLLNLPQGIYVQGGVVGSNGEEITVNHTAHTTRGPVPSRQFTIPVKDLYRIEGITVAEPDLWQNPSYTWDFRAKKK